MGTSLEALRRPGLTHTLELDDTGFVLRRRANADPEAFNHLVREAINSAGSEYVALPRPGRGSGYGQLVIVTY